MHALRGRVVLLVEDELREAQRIVQYLRLRGASVLGPVPTVSYALEIIQTERLIDYALVDRILRDSESHAVADALLRRGIPFVFLNGDKDAELPPEYRHVPCRPKPLALPELAQELLATLERAPLVLATPQAG